MPSCLRWPPGLCLQLNIIIWITHLYVKTMAILPSQRQEAGTICAGFGKLMNTSFIFTMMKLVSVAIGKIVTLLSSNPFARSHNLSSSSRPQSRGRQRCKYMLFLRKPCLLIRSSSQPRSQPEEEEPQYTLTIEPSPTLASTLLIDTTLGSWNGSSDISMPSSSLAMQTKAPLLVVGVAPMFLILPYIDM